METSGLKNTITKVNSVDEVIQGPEKKEICELEYTAVEIAQSE